MSNTLTSAHRARIVSCLVEGNSMRATQRMTGHAKRTVEAVLHDAGENCRKLMDARMVNLPCEQIQCDEIWSFIFCKAKNLKFPGGKPTGAGDSWCWVAIDPVSKLIPAWYCGDRSAQSAYTFLHALEPRLANRVQLTTDGQHAYLIAVKAAFLARSIDYAMLVKIYGEPGGGGKYSPGECIGATKEPIMGHPDKALISTSHVERQNLTMRMQMRRFTRLTNAFSKGIDSHRAALALHFAHYNFCRIHQTIRCTPAMEAKLTDYVWSIEELISPAHRAPKTANAPADSDTSATLL